MFDLWNSLYPDMMIYVLQEVIILLSHSMKTETFNFIYEKVCFYGQRIMPDSNYLMHRFDIVYPMPVYFYPCGSW